MFRISSPVSELSPYIECYWFADAQSTQHSIQLQRLLVDGRADLMFTFGCRYNVLTVGGNFRSSYHQAHVNAQRKFPLIVTQNHQPLIGVRFRPGGLIAFTPIPAVELSDLSIEAAALFGSAASELEYRLFDNQHHASAQIACLDEFFLKRLNVPADYAAARAAALRIEGNNGQIRVAQLSNEFGYSSRTIDRQFAQIFGYTPKFYTRIIRFHHALSLLEKGQCDLTSVSYHTGYYDQSHFIKDCRQFMGATPQQYLASVPTRKMENVYHVRFLQSEDSKDTYTLQGSLSVEDRRTSYEP